MTRTPEQPQFVFAVCAHGDGPEEHIRVKRLLKRLGRQHGLRVTWPDLGSAAPSAPAAQPTHAVPVVEGTQ